jgi:glyoxylase-like metal-dependent hydrolase (beta-lactamase superfamily II)
VTGSTEVAARLGEIGLEPDAVDFVTISHLHFDHAGGTSRFPKARFIVQRRELEYAAGALPHHGAARSAFVAEDVLALVRLDWEGRVLLVDGDAEAVVPGLDVYPTPGHTAGTNDPQGLDFRSVSERVVAVVQQGARRPALTPAGARP